MPPFGVRRLNGNDANSRVWTSTFRPNTAMGEQAERYPAAVKIQAILRGFIVRIRELNSVLLYTVKNAAWRLSGFQVLHSRTDFVPDLQFNRQSSRWLHNNRFNPNGRNRRSQLWNSIIYTDMGLNTTEPLSFNQFIQARIRDRWNDRRVILQDWFWHRKRVGIKMLDFDTPDAPQPSTNPARRSLRPHVPLRERS